MKYVILVFIVAACSKKDKGTCYECQITGVDGNTGQPYNETRNICTDRIDTVRFKDSNGNALQYVCHEK